MARKSLQQIKASRPAADRRKIETTTEEDIARHMFEDGEVPPAPELGRKEGEQER